MSTLYNPAPITEKSKQHAISELLDKTKHDRDFYVLLVGAALLALGAIFTDSIPVLIASMIVAPLASPILALGLGIVAGSRRLMTHALVMLVISVLVTLAIAVVITLVFNDERVEDRYISFASNRHIAVAVAVISGLIAAYGMARPKVASAITGVAIAVSLMPPLVATGVGFASGARDMGMDALVLFLLNVIGILLASVCVFWRFGLRQEYWKNKEADKILW